MFAHFRTTLLAAAAVVSVSTLAAQPLLVAAAADVAPLETKLKQGFAAAGGGSAQFVFGASGMLARQIESGAPYDVFLSADERLVQGLAAQGKLARGSVVVYATGRLGLWSAHQAVPANLAGLLDAKYRMVAVANPEHAPYGAAARVLLERAGLWSRLQPRIVLAENVRQAFEFASTGNADAVITSWTLLWNQPGAKLLPADSHPPIRQSGGVVAGTSKEARARAFLRFLLSPAGQAILHSGGLFAPPSPGH